MTYRTDGNFVYFNAIPNYRLQIPENETPQSVATSVFVLDCISMLMGKCIPEIGSKPLTTVMSTDTPNPICFRVPQLIIIHSIPSRWAQIAYQFSHELCHYAIPGDVASNLRWIEESICETASLYFLRAISLYWKETGVSYTTADENKPYYQSFLDYARNEENKIEAFDLLDLRMRDYLETHCEDRLKNTYLARHLLPIFFKYPETWKAVPFLCNIHEPTLPEALDEWILLSPEVSHPGLFLIRDLFQPKHPQNQAFPADPDPLSST